MQGSVDIAILVNKVHEFEHDELGDLNWSSAENRLL